ncbi:SEC-C metal-binding domain-containing protein [Bradyrhizobium sp. LHD-71]|uniref:SEC-C metal-binding domain-containing protein n=1 Tax=Bradyrhizobium sp. LHD-71 TaxID=3072141 RepID=UPI0035BE37FB
MTFWNCGMTQRNAPCPCGSGKKFKHRHGKVPAKNNIAGILLDAENNRRIVVTKDFLLNQLHRDGPKVARSFDRLNESGDAGRQCVDRRSRRLADQQC